MKKIEKKHIEAVKTILEFIGEDINREGLEETPKRFLRAWAEYWGVGYYQKLEDFDKSFEDGAEQVNEMVIVKDIPVFSHCEHHIAPIIGKCHVAYIPNGKIIGLSKIARIVNMYSRRLQVQERLTNQIADAIVKITNCKGVGVIVNAEHFCMTSRGIQAFGSTTITSALRGVFLKQDVKEEFFKLVDIKK